MSRDRLDDAAGKVDLESTSLVGSFFLSDVDRGWQGCVVAEVAPQVYLVETFDWLVGSSYNQVLVRLEEMTDWQFFDSGQWMADSYNNRVSMQWDAIRKERDGS
jgi:hypothetical protein